MAGLLALIAGAGVSSEWNSWILFTHARDFGIEDPQFDTDIGFYVFRLPFLTFLVGWLFAALLIVLIVTAVAHYLNGGIRMSSPRNRVTPQVKAHLSVLLGLLALVKAVGYWLQRYELTASTRGFVDGAGYTDVNAQLPGHQPAAADHGGELRALHHQHLAPRAGRCRSSASACGRSSRWSPARSTRSSCSACRWSRTSPRRSSRTSPATSRPPRRRWGSSDVEVTPFELETDPDAIDLAGNADTDQQHPDLGPERPHPRAAPSRSSRASATTTPSTTSTSTATSSTASPPRWCSRCATSTPPASRGRRWAAEHLTYTHGYGAIVAPANEKESSGEPAFVAEDIPYRTSADELELTQPAVYFGEDLGGYVVVGSKQRELNFEDEDETKYTTYEGEDGVALDNVVKKAAFALRFGDVNPLISDQLTGSSQVLYIRDIRERVSALAPFLDLDADPYPVIHDGRIVWIVDAYTTTSRYPYAQRVETGQLPDESGLDHTFNYVRNSVKAVVDAYDGTVDFYVMPVDDPIIEAYRDAFPGLFKDFEEMPEDLQAHLRYPEDLFRIQTNSWAKYHVDRGRQLLPGQRLLGRRPRPRHRHGHPRRDDARAPRPRPRRGLDARQPHGPDRPVLPVHQAARRRPRRSSCSSGRSCPSGPTTTASS